MASAHSLPPGDRALYSKLRQLLEYPGLIVGSLVTMRRTCGKPTCHCRTETRHRHRSLYVAVRVGRKRKLLYVPPEWETLVTDWIGRYDDVRSLLQKLSESFVRRLLERES